MAEKKNKKETLELPEPEEKLLRSPTFWEKNEWAKPVLLVVVTLAVLLIGILLFRMNNERTSKTTIPDQMVTPTTTQVMDETMYWQTFVSPSGKFEIKYPSNYKVNTLDENTFQLFSGPYESFNANFTLTIRNKNFNGTQNLQQLIAQNPVCPTINAGQGTSGTINGEADAQIFIDTACGQLTQTVVYTINENILYIMTVESEAKFNEIKPILDKVLRTFKFTNENTDELPEPPNEVGLCTQDARQCPDGSWVGRSGPNCEFFCPAN